MTFDPNANLDTSQVSSGGRGRGVAVGGGLGGGALLVVIVISLLTGTDPSSLLNGGSDPQPGSTSDVSRCRTGEDANRDVECRVVGTVNSVQAFWATALPQQARTQYVQARTVLYSGQTQSACGTASNAVGPFYCPSDKPGLHRREPSSTSLTTRFGADDGALAQEYVVAHEYGHHVQDLLGDLGRAQQGSGATGGSVRTEPAGRLLRRHVGQGGVEHPGRRRRPVPAAVDEAGRRVGAVGRVRRRRRPHPAAVRRRREPRDLDARVVGGAAALVHPRLHRGHPRGLRHLRDRPACRSPGRPAYQGGDGALCSGGSARCGPPAAAPPQEARHDRHRHRPAPHRLPRGAARPPGAAGLDVGGTVGVLVGLPRGRRLAAHRHHHARRAAAARGLPPGPHRGLERARARHPRRPVPPRARLTARPL
nr:neutral zinc metallopeptidase [Angustibacter aerolatus]